MEEEAKEGYSFFNLSSEYLHSITQLLVPSGDEVMKDAVKQAGMDVRFMRLFYLCLSHWDFTNSDEQRLRSIITDLEDIWGIHREKGRVILNRHKHILYRLRETDVQHFHTEDFKIKGEIQLSKLMMEEKCGNLLLCSGMRCRPLAYSEFRQFLRLVQESLDEFLNCGAAELKKQIGIFRDMIHFLRQSMEILTQNFTDSNNRIEFMDFVGVFSQKAAYLTCLYWAKEDNEEAATEMNIVLLNMMHEFIPSAPDVTASYFRILCSTENSQAPLPINIEAFVAFYFEHLATTIPSDDYLFFRDQMISHLTFLAYYAHENTEVFSEQKSIILHDFMTKTETTFAKARLHYYGFSDSWVGMEAAEMVYVSFHPIQRKLCLIGKRLNWHDAMLSLYEMELTFLRTFMLWLAICDDSDEEIRLRLRSIIVSLQGIWGKEEEVKGFLAARLSVNLFGIAHSDRNSMDPIYELNGKIQLSKKEIQTWLLNWFHCSLPYKLSTSNKILKFIDSILNSLNGLVNSRSDEIVVPIKKQIETLKDKLIFLHNWLKLSENCAETKELGEFNMLVQVFAIDAAFLTFLYWIKVDIITATEVDRIFSNMLQKIKPDTPDIGRLYFGALKAIYLQRSDSLLFGQTASIFVDNVFEDSETFSKDDFQILRDDVIFLLTFLNDPPNWGAEELIWNQIDNHFWEGVYDLLPIDDMNGDFSEKKVLLRCFMTKIETVIGNIRMHYCEFPDSPLYDLPKITSPYHLNFLIQNLRNLKERMINDCKFVPFAKYKIIKLEEELVSMRPFFNYVFELRNELNDTWLQVMNLVHLTECLIDSCISSWFVFDHPIWYYMAYFSDIFDKIKVIKVKVEKIKENNVISCLSHSPRVIRTLSKQTSTSEIDEVMVGFKDDARKITDNLRGGHKSLDVVSIVGMGGLGKTTLAKKVCSIVKDEFHISAIYTVSQEYNIRMVLLGILKNIIRVDDEISSMTNDDLAHKLWKCLSRKKYLIVLDDIWNVIAWNEVRRSFPDDQNGSRVMLTTRFHEVANKCIIQCKPFQPSFLSMVESWELLQKKVFQDDIPPSSLLNIGRKIAESCKGLPLSIVVIAGVLAGKERSESVWSEIAENVHSYLSDDERCKKILELSYNHLPEYLKPCVLYLGAYPEDKVIRVNDVIRLWIAEGFVEKSETASIEDVAKEYFHNLVERSLLIVNSRSSRGQIKDFRVHDLIHNMCQTKCHEGNFFKLGREIAASSSGSETVFCLKENTDYEKNYPMYNQYRISVVHATNGSGSPSVEDASTLLFFIEGEIHEYSSLFSGVIMNLRHAQVLYSEGRINETHFRQMLSLVNLRHLHVCNFPDRIILSTISNLWNLQSVILTDGSVDFPETFWKLKNLRYVKVSYCSLKFSDDADEQLDKVVSFSRARLSSAKDVEKLLQRLPAVRKLGISIYSGRSRVEVEPLDFCRKLESLTIYGYMRFSQINFPSTLKKLSLRCLGLPSTTLSAIAQLHCLRVLKLHYISFMQPRLEMEDLVFQSLVFIHLVDEQMIQWNASAESFPCLEQIRVQYCYKLEELPPCFLEISTLKKIQLVNSPIVKSSALRIQEEQIEFGNHVQIDLGNSR